MRPPPCLCIFTNQRPMGQGEDTRLSVFDSIGTVRSRQSVPRRCPSLDAPVLWHLACILAALFSTVYCLSRAATTQMVRLRKIAEEICGHERPLKSWAQQQRQQPMQQQKIVNKVTWSTRRTGRHDDVKTRTLIKKSNQLGVVFAKPLL